MRSLLVATLVGICGSIAFEALNEWAGWLTLSGPKKWFLLSGIFVSFFVVAAFIDKNAMQLRARKSVASGNVSSSEQDVDLQDVSIRADSDAEIASNNKSKGNQKIVIRGKVDL